MQVNKQVTIVIPTIGRVEQLVRLLNSIEKSSSKRYEIIIVNDSSKPLNLSVKISNIKILNNINNKGLAYSRTKGASLAKGKYILFIDDDNVVGKGMIEELTSSLQSYPELIAVGPLTYYLSNKKKIAFLGANINLRTSRTTFTTSYTERELKDKKIFITGNLHNCFMVRKKLGDRVGWFDEEVFMSGTEFDMFQKVKTVFKGMLGTDILAFCFHDILDISKNNSNFILNYSTRKNRIFYYQRNKGLLASRYGSLFDKIALALIYYPLFSTVYGFMFLRKFNLPLLYENCAGVFKGYLYLLKIKL